MSVFIAEPDLNLPTTTLAQLRALAELLPFEAAMLAVALLNVRVEPVLNDPAGQWTLAQEFYAGQPDLLARYERVRESAPARLIFSPQPITLLMRVLIDHAREEPLRALTSGEFQTLQRAVLGAHSALESSLGALPMPTRENVLAYELQASTFFHRPPLLGEMARHQEFLDLMIAEDSSTSANRVPVDEWLAASGMTVDEQWAVGFGLSAMTNAFTRRAVASELAGGGLSLPRDEPCAETRQCRACFATPASSGRSWSGMRWISRAPPSQRPERL